MTDKKQSEEKTKGAPRKKVDRLLAFQLYCTLGAGRTHEKVARHFGVRTDYIGKISAKDKWKERLANIKEIAREEAEKKLEEEEEISMLSAMRLERLSFLKAGTLIRNTKNMFHVKAAWDIARVTQKKPTVCTRNESVGEEEVTTADIERIAAENRHKPEK
jgi:hypothetical protein